MLRYLLCERQKGKQKQNRLKEGSLFTKQEIQEWMQALPDRDLFFLTYFLFSFPSMVPPAVLTALCNEDANGNVPLGKSCNRYWQCQGGYPRLQRCPAMLVFDRRSLRCVVPPTEDCDVPTTPLPLEYEPEQQQQQQQQGKVCLGNNYFITIQSRSVLK